MIKLDEVDSSIVLYYHDTNWENVDDILEICHHKGGMRRLSTL